MEDFEDMLSVRPLIRTNIKVRRQKWTSFFKGGRGECVQYVYE